MMSMNSHLVNSGPGTVVVGQSGPGSVQMMLSGGSTSAQMSNGGSPEKNVELLFNLSAIEVRDDFEERMCRTYLQVQNILANKSESQANEELIKLVGQSPSTHEDITIGMIVSMLLEPHNTQRYYRDMIHISRDALTLFIYNIQIIANEKYFRLHEQTRRQMVRLIRELVNSNSNSLELIFYSMFRNIVCGDLSPGNIFLAESLLDILIEFRPLLEKNVVLQSFALYNYLRLFMDHFSPPLRDLRAKEASFCSSLIREKFGDFIWIGRDLVRLLQQVAVAPEFEPIWRDLVYHPSKLAHGFSGIAQLMKTRTPRRFLKLKLTVEMEKKITFLTNHVRMPHHIRYQDWLQKSYFNTHESLMLRSDWIRYICLMIHPSNVVLSTDIIPRWALIGWLLNVPYQGMASHMKHALFYDWFFFDDKDTHNYSIMDIEPAILTIFGTLRNYPTISEALLEFICKVSNAFHPSMVPLVKQGIRNSFTRICEARVVNSLLPLIESPKIDEKVRQLFRDTFPEFSFEPQHQPLQQFIQTGPIPGQQLIIVQGPSGQTITTVSQPSVIQQPNLNMMVAEGNTSAHFSDDEEDPREPSHSPNKKLKKSNSFNGSNNIKIEAKGGPNAPIPSSNSLEYITSIIHNSVQSNSASHGNGNGTPNNVAINDASNGANHHQTFISPLLKNSLFNTNGPLSCSSICGNSALSKEELHEQIEHFSKAEIRSCLLKFFQEKNKTTRCQEINKLAKLVLNDDVDEFEEYSTSLTIILLALLEDDLSVRIFPLDFNRSGQTPNEKELKDSITGPLFVMFRILAESIEDDQTTHSSLLTLLAAMGTNNSKVGYLLFYFLIVSNYMSGRMSIYRNYAREMSKEITDSLLTDLRCCAYDDVYMFFYLLPEIFINFSSSFSIPNYTDIIKLIVCHIDPLQLQALLGRIISGSIKLLRKEAVMPVLTASLDWDSHEQYFTWQIILAHNISADQVIPILAKLEYSVHSEALSNLMLFIQRVAPTATLVKHLLNRESKSGDNFTVSILIQWAQNHAEKLSDLIGNFVSTKISSPNKRNKRTQNNSTKSQVSIPTNIEQILFYLDEMRKMSKNNSFFTLEFMTIVLDQLRQLSSASQKAKYQELFTNVPDDNDNSKNSSSASTSSTNNKKATSSGNNNKKNQPLSKTRSGNTVNSSKNNDSETESDSSDEDVPLTKSKAPTRKKRKAAIGSDSD